MLKVLGWTFLFEFELQISQLCIYMCEFPVVLDNLSKKQKKNNLENWDWLVSLS
jgi:hypothetical protein